MIYLLISTICWGLVWSPRSLLLASWHHSVLPCTGVPILWSRSSFISLDSDEVVLDFVEKLIPTYLPSYLPTCLSAYLPICLPTYLSAYWAWHYSAPVCFLELQILVFIRILSKSYFLHLKYSNIYYKAAIFDSSLLGL